MHHSPSVSVNSLPVLSCLSSSVSLFSPQIIWKKIAPTISFHPKYFSVYLQTRIFREKTSITTVLTSPSALSPQSLIGSTVRSVWRREWQPTPLFLPGESHGHRSLVGCSPWARRELDTTERLSTHTPSVIKFPCFMTV